MRRWRGRRQVRRARMREAKEARDQLSAFSLFFSLSPHLFAHRVRGVLVVLGRAPEAEERLGRGRWHERRGEGRGDGGAGGERRAASRRLGLLLGVFFEAGVFFFPSISMREIEEETRMIRKGTMGSQFGPRRGVERGAKGGENRGTCFRSRPLLLRHACAFFFLQQTSLVRRPVLRRIRYHQRT